MPYAGPDTVDDAGDVAPGDVRQWDAHTGETVALPEVKVIESAGFHPDHHFPGPRYGIRYVLIAESLGTAMFMESYGFH
jgi:hypothetical protein